MIPRIKLDNLKPEQFTDFDTFYHAVDALIMRSAVTSEKFEFVYINGFYDVPRVAMQRMSAPHMVDEFWLNMGGCTILGLRVELPFTRPSERIVTLVRPEVVAQWFPVNRYGDTPTRAAGYLNAFGACAAATRESYGFAVEDVNGLWHAHITGRDGEPFRTRLFTGDTISINLTTGDFAS